MEMENKYEIGFHVADHCEALRRILDCGVAGQSYNIGGDCEMTNLDLISSIYDELISTQIRIGACSNG